jgi:hypothetical protein
MHHITKLAAVETAIARLAGVRSGPGLGGPRPEPEPNLMFGLGKLANLDLDPGFRSGPGSNNVRTSDGQFFFPNPSKLQQHKQALVQYNPGNAL